MIPAVTMDASVDRAAVNQNVRVAIAPANTAGADITPAMAIPAEADQTIDNVSIAITKARAFRSVGTARTARRELRPPAT